MGIPSEKEGCAVLKRVFEARGYKIQENVLLEFGDVSFTVDGWDPGYRVGYEYMTSADHDDVSTDEAAQLAEWNAEGRIALFMIDHADVQGEKELEYAANSFLDDLVAKSRGA